MKNVVDRVQAVQKAKFFVINSLSFKNAIFIGHQSSVAANLQWPPIFSGHQFSVAAIHHGSVLRAGTRVLQATAAAGAILREAVIVRIIRIGRLQDFLPFVIRFGPLVLEVELAASFDKKWKEAKALHPGPEGPATPDDPDDQNNLQAIAAIADDVLAGQKDAAMTVFKLKSEKHLPKKLK
jgi:hypothetical protein